MKRISMRSLLVGIDPGSLYTRVVVADAQQEISEPSLAAVTTQGEVVAVGTEAAIRLRAEPRNRPPRNYCYNRFWIKCNAAP